MKKIIALLLFVVCAGSIYAQTYKVDLDATVMKKYEHFKKGDKIKITDIIHTTEYDGFQYVGSYYIVINNDTLPITSKLGDRLEFQYKNTQDVWDAKIASDVLVDLEKKGVQKELRDEMEKDALEYITKVKGYGMEFNDPYLENYIYSLIAKIAPETIVDGRPGSVNLLILEDDALNACIYPNGTLVINTGLLSALHSEDELVAILSHEIAHFVLDHSIDNVNMAKTRQKRAEFWAAVVTGVAAMAEGVAASKNKYYVPGAVTLGTAMLASTIAADVIDRLGMKYDHEQEFEADKLAIQILSLLGYDENALATALMRIETQMVVERNNAIYFASYTHPALIDRIQKAGKPQGRKSRQFEKEISFAVTSSARIKYENRRFKQAMILATQNIENGVATAEDFIIKANCLLALQNSMDSNRQVVELINSAKSVDPGNINIYKADILAHLRLGDRSKAIELLHSYLNDLEKMRLQLKEIESDTSWDALNSFINTEQNWSNRMQIKLRAMAD